MFSRRTGENYPKITIRYSSLTSSLLVYISVFMCLINKLIPILYGENTMAYIALDKRGVKMNIFNYFSIKTCWDSERHF